MTNNEEYGYEQENDFSFKKGLKKLKKIAKYTPVGLAAQGIKKVGVKKIIKYTPAGMVLGAAKKGYKKVRHYDENGYEIENDFSFKKLKKNIKKGTKFVNKVASSKVGKLVKKVGGGVIKAGGNMVTAAIKSTPLGATALKLGESGLKIGKSLGKKAKKTVAIVQTSVGSEIISPLDSLKPSMVKVLASKGESTSGATVDVAQKFYNKIIKPEKGTNNYFKDSDNFLTDNPLFYVHKNHAEEVDNSDTVQIDIVVSEIIKYFTDAKKKVDENTTGKPVTVTEAIAADETKKVTQKLAEKAAGVEPVTQKDNNKTMYMIGGIAVIALIGFFVMRGK